MQREPLGLWLMGDLAFQTAFLPFSVWNLRFGEGDLDLQSPSPLAKFEVFWV
jgi:hypothetical protein